MMSIARVKLLFRGINPHSNHKLYQGKRPVTSTPSGSLLPEPKKTPFGILGIICAVIPGLLIGATISKNMANFLEENELFVPSDDDDDDD
ncbi:essential MCU regulator, mitochondrial [Diprion similis]|uniref:essential MCU regulator, mitochondrial n=1 Tax=Diprion similis TaxID=362088 RepID=UPI001EF99C5D|nr:essential MCU regulator, mitochondrial [Diprion similis]